LIHTKVELVINLKTGVPRGKSAFGSHERRR